MDEPLDKYADCPVTATIAVVGGKWRPRILWRLREGPARFGELRRIVGVSEKVLSQNLKALEDAGVIRRTRGTAGAVVTAQCEFSDYGRTLIPVLDAMGAWGLRHRVRP
jgi:DNA-binding HxlR family transcriptional regulator